MNRVLEIIGNDQLALNIITGLDSLDNHPGIYEDLFRYFCDNGEMPYGIAKARIGDPYEWIEEKIFQAIA